MTLLPHELELLSAMQLHNSSRFNMALFSGARDNSSHH